MAKPLTPSASNPSLEINLETAQPMARKKGRNADRALSDKPVQALPMGQELPEALTQKKLAAQVKKTLRDDEELADAEHAPTADEGSSAYAAAADGAWVLAQAAETTATGASGGAATTAATTAGTVTATAVGTSAAVSMSTVAAVAGGLLVAAAAGGGGGGGGNAPAITTPGSLSLLNFSDSGNASDKITSDKYFDLSISGQTSGATVVYQRSTDGGTTWADVASSQSNLADGNYQFRAKVTSNGNTAYTDPINITVDATAPVPTVQTASGTTVTLTFDGALDAAHLPSTGAFSVTQGNSSLTVTAVELVGTNTLKLTLASALSTGALTVSYSDPTAGDDANAVQDAAGNDAVSFTTGVLADGYISGATIKIDTNGDGVGDVTVGKTDAGGRFFVNAEAQALLAQGGVLMASGGFNIDTGVANTLVLKSAGALTINPLTTVIQAVAESSGISVAAAADQVADSLGINLGAGQSLADYDPIANGDTAAQKVAAQIATVATLAASTGASSEARATASTAVMGQLADLITTATTNGSSDVSLTDANTLNSMVSAALTGSSASIEELKSTIAQAATEISQATSLSDVSAKQSQFLDKVAPALPGIDNQAVGNDPTPDLTFTLDISATDGTAAVATDKLVLMEGDRELASYALNTAGVDLVKGKATLNVPTALSDGVHTLKAFLVDQSGNVGAAKTFTVNIDTAAPLAPVVNVVAGDDVVNASETSFTVTGAAEAGATIRYSSALSTVAGADGSWSLALPASVVSPLTTGSLSFTATDAAGNISIAGTRAITVDRDAPTVTSGLPQALDNVDPTTGSIAAASTTNDNTPTFSGTLSAPLSSGDQVVVYDGSTPLGVATVDGTSWTFNSPALSNAAHSITVRVQDAAGNQGTASAALAFTVQATVPTAVAAITVLADDVGSASNVVNGGLTNDEAPVLTGTLSAALAQGDVVKVYDGKGMLVGNATVNANNWSLQLSGLSDGAHSYKAVVENAGGNQGAMSAAFGFTVDTTAPGSTGITINAVSGDNKVSGAEKIAGFAVTGSAEPGSQVQLTWGGTQKAATTSAAGLWSIALIANDVPNDATNSSISVVVTDAAGNDSGAVTSANIVIDTTGPSSTTLNAVAGNNIINGTEAKDGVVLSGTTEANATVLLPIGASIVRSLSANAQGVFSYTLTQADIKALGEGAGKKFSMTAIDVSGNRAAAVDSEVFSIDTSAPVLSSFTLAKGSDTGTSAQDGISNNRTPTINFTVENVTGTSTVVEVASVSSQGVVGSYSAVSGVSVAQGAGSATLALTDDGAYSVRVTATDAAGNTSVREGKYVLDTTAPSVPAELKLADSSNSGLKTDNISNVNRPTAEFTVEKGATLAAEYRIKGENGSYTSVGSVVGTGVLQSATTDKALPADGNYEFRYTLTDVAGNATQFTKDYTLDTHAPVVTAVTDDTNATFTNAVIHFAVTFGEALASDASIDNFIATNGTVNSVTKVDATHYTVVVTPTTGVATGEVALGLIGGALKDVAGNAVADANLATLDAQGIDTLAPSFTSSATATVAENTATSAAVYTAVATDANTPHYGLSGYDAALFNVDSSTGAVTFKTSPNFEAPADTGGDNVYNFTLTATDAVGNASQKDVALTVGDVNEAPTADAISAQTVVNGQAFSVNLASSFHDVDASNNGTLSFALKSGSTLPGGLSLNSAGVLSGTASADASPVNVTVVATDGGNLSAEQTFALSVVSAPVIQSFTVSDTTTSNGAQLGKAGEALVFTVTMSEVVTVTGGTPTIVFNMGGQSVTGTYQSGTGTNTLVFSGTAPSTGSGNSAQVTGVSLNGATVTGAVSHQIWATAGTGQSYSGYTLDNTAPSVSTSSLNMAENSTAGTTLVANETVTWSMGTGGDESLFSLSGASLSLKAAKNYEADVTSTHAYTVNVVATDTAGNQATKAITVNLTDVNEAPTGRDIGPQILVNGQVLENANLSDLFSDVDAGSYGTLSFALKAGSTLPVGLSVVNGFVVGTPTVDSGPVDVTFVATDGGGLSVEQTVSLSVVSAPTLSAGNLGSQTALDVSSNLVLSVGETVTAVAGKFITITDTGGTHYRGENATHNFVVDAKDVTITGTGANTKIVIDPSALFDLDLSSTYSISVEAGAFMGSTSHQGSLAMSAVSFGTVTPATSLAAAAQSYRMNNTTGAIEAANKWVDIEGNGVGSTNTDATTAFAFDATGGNFTFVFKDVLVDGGSMDAGTAGIETATDFAVVLKNFGAGDRVYVDDAFNDPTKVDIPSAEVFGQGNGSVGAGALKWGLVGGNGDPQLYLELESLTSANSSLAAVNTALGLNGQGYNSAVLVF